MKTHDVAKVLTSLAHFLRSGRNVELDQLTNSFQQGGRPSSSLADIPIALSALVALSQFDKAQWKSVIEEYGLPIAVKDTESRRDVLGKVLKHLEQNSESRAKLKQAAGKSKSDLSPELMNALNFLLK